MHDTDEPYLYNKGRQYQSNVIENAESIGVRDANDLCTNLLKPLFLHTISTVVSEEWQRINHITVNAVLRPRGGDHEPYDLIYYQLDDPQSTIHLFSDNCERVIYSFPEHLLNAPFCIWVGVFFYFISDEDRNYLFMAEFASRQGQEAPEEDHSDPPDETFRQDLCVVCLESAPNILYLDCMHIAVCDFCDRMKRTEALRKNCDICRVEISRRIKI